MDAVLHHVVAALQQQAERVGNEFGDDSAAVSRALDLVAAAIADGLAAHAQQESSHA